MAPKRIILRGQFTRVEGTASAAVTPGHLVKSVAAGVAVHSVSGGRWSGLVAVEREMGGDGIDVAYAASDTILLGAPHPGALIHGLVAAGALAIIKDDPLVAAADGTVRKYTGPADGAPETVMIPVEDLAANADIAERLEFRVPASLNGALVKSVYLLSKGAPADIDDSNTCLVKLTKIGTGDIVSETFDSTTAFPAANAVHDLGAVTNGTLATGDRLGIVVTNGTTANPPAFALVIEFEGGHIVGHAEEAVDNSGGGAAVRIKWRKA